ncbi:MAG: polysaccharide deacetylase family protein [Lachnospiraceae bacterium]|nr:polysaccharide deacetylase family protein [Lachnospiraceae bacterium]
MRQCDMEQFLSTLCRDRKTLEMFRHLVNGSYIRVVNYHSTDPVNAERYEAEVKYFSENFVPVTFRDLDTFFETKKWPYNKPGLIPAIFEGFRNQYDVMLPILDKYHFTGWFYLPSFYMDVPVEEQIAFSDAHELDLIDKELYPDKRVAMNWDEVREIASRHEICCHTGTHFQIFPDTPEEDMYREIVLSKKKLEEEIGREVQLFCWLYGANYGYNVRAQKFLKEAGYKYVLGNLEIEKIR